MIPRALSLPLIAAAAIGTALFSAPAAGATTTLVDTYTCDNVMKSDIGDGWAGWGNCVGSAGAPTSGPLPAATRNLVNRTTSVTVVCTGDGQAVLPDLVALNFCS
ncbi:hypothetical protein DP939_00290 [Spongiactinospora rosea]|uniref:Secreted protein n=1 Tax=Spongiactinospora rosea TaxID=2248750 RepID=A0A366M659_9ACTN|nr:hypothetical protein [Spongiactinospora rosea]RBQ21210.1 hypothetical protein DP939_00290 [Spongiactinospora rosea]